MQKRPRREAVSVRGEDYLVGTLMAPLMILALTASTLATWALLIRALLYWSTA